MTQKGDPFRCGVCKQVYKADRDHQEAVAESEIVFGEVKPQDRAVVCDDCYKRFMEWYEAARRSRRNRN